MGPGIRRTARRAHQVPKPSLGVFELTRAAIQHACPLASHRQGQGLTLTGDLANQPPYHTPS